MLVEKFTVDHLLYHPEFEVVCGDPVTFVIGPNGCGKTILLDALFSMFYPTESPEQALIGDIRLQPNGIVPMAHFHGTRAWQFHTDQVPFYMNPLIHRLDLARYLEVVNDFLMWKRVELQGMQLVVVDERDRPAPPTSTNPTIEWHDLSRTERNWLWLLFQMYVGAHPGTLFLLDEPEAGLSTVRQRQFLKEWATETAEQLDHQFIVATHSPELIHDGWELCYDLMHCENVRIGD